MERPEITQRVIQAFADVLDRQDTKGVEKYGENIDAASDVMYDWNLMALEECADLFKYLVKENQRLQKEVQELLTLDVYICIGNHEFAVKEDEEPDVCPFCQEATEWSHAVRVK